RNAAASGCGKIVKGTEGGRPSACGFERNEQQRKWTCSHRACRHEHKNILMNEKRLVIVDGLRTPFSKAGTELASLGADELGRTVVNSLLMRTGLDPALVDEVIFGCVAQPVDAANVARVIALRSGIPESVPAITVQRNCASGCEAITLAQEKMLAG